MVSAPSRPLNDDDAPRPHSTADGPPSSDAAVSANALPVSSARGHAPALGQRLVVLAREPLHKPLRFETRRPVVDARRGHRAVRRGGR